MYNTNNGQVSMKSNLFFIIIMSQVFPYTTFFFSKDKTISNKKTKIENVRSRYNSNLGSINIFKEIIHRELILINNGLKLLITTSDNRQQSIYFFIDNAINYDNIINCNNVINHDNKINQKDMDLNGENIILDSIKIEGQLFSGVLEDNDNGFRVSIITKNNTIIKNYYYDIFQKNLF